ncbi:MAG: hypothetical protein WBV06_04350 [Acidimicrobiia bacterium]
MGQQPNIELEISDLPRPRRKPDPAPSWVPDRPGELGGPEDMRSGAGFGRIGPDSGYALSLIAGRELDLAEGEHRANVGAALAAIVSARSSLYGRAPTGKDVDLAVVLLGLDPGIPESLRSELAEKRKEWFAAAGHNPTKLYSFVSSLDTDVLRLTAGEARSRMAAGTALIAN